MPQTALYLPERSSSPIAHPAHGRPQIYQGFSATPDPALTLCALCTRPCVAPAPQVLPARQHMAKIRILMNLPHFSQFHHNTKSRVFVNFAVALILSEWVVLSNLYMLYQSAWQVLFVLSVSPHARSRSSECMGKAGHSTQIYAQLPPNIGQPASQQGTTLTCIEKETTSGNIQACCQPAFLQKQK